MKKIIKNLKKKFLGGLILFHVGIFLGWLIFHSSSDGKQPLGQEEMVHEDHDHEEAAATVWTCSMHPQIRLDHPGQCPICAMDLIPLSEMQQGGDDIDPDEIQMTESAARLADIQTRSVQRGRAEKTLYLQGKVRADERNIAELTARFGGRIEKLFVSFTGEHVVKGEKLATIYSPELVTAQRELLEALGYKEERPSLYKAARGKLKLWDLTDEQIDEIEAQGDPRLYFEILSPISGTVTRRHVALGDYVKEGTALFEVTDLTHVWIMLDAYESDLPWISKGDRVTYNLQSLPGRSYSGSVSYIDPFIDPETRVVKVRVEKENPDLSLKPEMFVNGTIESDLAAGSSEILIPKSSILWTGKRSVVYVKMPEREQPSFMYREIILGPESGDSYVVSEGLSEGEEIAVNGVFKIDAAAQLAGKPSMMNPQGGIVSTGHNHGSMEMSAMDQGTRAGTVVTVDNRTQPGTAEFVSETSEIPDEFRRQLQAVYESYLPMKNSFVASDAEAVRKGAGMVRAGLQDVDMELLEGDAHMEWMTHLKVLESSIAEIEEGQDLEIQRVSFAAFNDAFYNSLKAFGLEEKTVYYQYCPMANGDQGAFWLSEIKEIENPYFGDAMLSCGETRETIKF